MATRIEAAEHLGVTPNHFDKLRREGKVRASPNGRAGYDLKEVRMTYITYLKEDNHRLRVSKTPEPPKEGTPDTKDLIEQERLKKMQAENARLSGDLIHVNVLKGYAEQLGNTVHEGLEALAGNIKKRIPHLRSAEVAQIKKEIAKTVNAIADFNPDHKASA